MTQLATTAFGSAAETLKEETDNVEKKESAWGTFWKGEYDKANEEAADAADAADASGLN